VEGENLRRSVAEFVGAFALIFVGAGSIMTGGGDLLGVAVAHGLILAIMVTALGHISGGHFNPAAKPHGHGGAAPEHHAGDMPNLKADANGVASATFSLSTISVGGGAADVVGKGLIVHRDPDDYKTQPTGNAGPRLACSVIRAS